MGGPGRFPNDLMRLGVGGLQNMILQVRALGSEASNAICGLRSGGFPNDLVRLGAGAWKIIWTLCFGAGGISVFLLLLPLLA